LQTIIKGIKDVLDKLK